MLLTGVLFMADWTYPVSQEDPSHCAYPNWAYQSLRLSLGFFGLFWLIGSIVQPSLCSHCCFFFSWQVRFLKTRDGNDLVCPPTPPPYPPSPPYAQHEERVFHGWGTDKVIWAFILSDQTLLIKQARWFMMKKYLVYVRKILWFFMKNPWKNRYRRYT